MTGLQTGIYPVAGPGGWQLLGYALRAVYDPWREQPFLIALGDTVRFEPEDGEMPRPTRWRGRCCRSSPSAPSLRVDEPGLLDLVVDGGRDMGGRFGMAQSGPVDARAARLANALVGNDALEPVLELTVRGPSLTALRAVRIAIAGPACVPWIGGQPAEALTTLELAAGDRLSFPHTGQGARSYLAIAGGIESERFMGSASTDVRGLVGRALVAGDVLGTGARGRLGDAHERARRLAGQRCDGAHPARPAGVARGARASRRRGAAHCGGRSHRSATRGGVDPGRRVRERAARRSGPCRSRPTATRSSCSSTVTARAAMRSRLSCTPTISRSSASCSRECACTSARRVFGVNSESVTIVVTAFMLGLGLGSLAGGWLSRRSAESVCCRCWRRSK